MEAELGAEAVARTVRWSLPKISRRSDQLSASVRWAQIAVTWTAFAVPLDCSAGRALCRLGVLYQGVYRFPLCDVGGAWFFFLSLVMRCSAQSWLFFWCYQLPLMVGSLVAPAKPMFWRFVGPAVGAVSGVVIRKRVPALDWRIGCDFLLCCRSLCRVSGRRQHWPRCNRGVRAYERPFAILASCHSVCGRDHR